MDEVLVDFVAGAFRLHGSNGLTKSDLVWDMAPQLGFAGDRRAEFWAPMGYDFWAGLDWTPEGKDVLEIVERKFGENVVLMTSPCETSGCAQGKLDWLKTNLPAYARKVMIGPVKHLTAGPGKLLIDDHEVNVDKFVAGGGKGLLVPRPWNRRKPDTGADGSFNVAIFEIELDRILNI